MVSVLDSGSSDPSSSHDGWGLPCDGLASHPGGSRNTPSSFMLGKLGEAPA